MRIIADFSIVKGLTVQRGCKSVENIKIDDIAALIAYSLDSFKGEVHLTLLGKTMELESACKQFGVRTSDREGVKVTTYCPYTRQFVLLLVNAMPFRTTSSVSFAFGHTDVRSVELAETVETLLNDNSFHAKTLHV